MHESLLRIPKASSWRDRIWLSRPYRLPRWLVNRYRYRQASATGKVRVRMRLGHEMELQPSQPFLRRVLVNRAYDDSIPIFLQSLLGQNPVIVDVGANIGLCSCAYAWGLREKNPVVYSIEAIRRNFDQLVRNVEMNGLTNVHPFHLALGESAGELSFSLPADLAESQGNFVGDNVLGAKAATSGAKEVVPMETLDHWAQRAGLSRCDFLKMDVEGAELMVLSGGREFLRRCRPYVICEFNRFFVECQGRGLADYLSFFAPLGYEVYEEQETHFTRLDPANFQASLTNLLFVPKGGPGPA